MPIASPAKAEGNTSFPADALLSCGSLLVRAPCKLQAGSLRQGLHGPQGLAAAAATREAAKRKRERDAGAGPAAKAPRRAARPIPVISHEVAVPKGYDAAARSLDPDRYGAR